MPWLGSLSGLGRVGSAEIRMSARACGCGRDSGRSGVSCGCECGLQRASAWQLQLVIKGSNSNGVPAYK